MMEITEPVILDIAQGRKTVRLEIRTRADARDLIAAIARAMTRLPGDSEGDGAVPASVPAPTGPGDGGVLFPAADSDPYDGRHPGGCDCQFCREDEREEQEQLDRDSADDDAPEDDGDGAFGSRTGIFDDQAPAQGGIAPLPQPSPVTALLSGARTLGGIPPARPATPSGWCNAAHPDAGTLCAGPGRHPMPHRDPHGREWDGLAVTA